MEEEIINKVANSSLEIFDLEEYFPKEKILGIDISQWLEEGYLLKEKEFRNHLKNFDWDPYFNNGVYIYCSTDAILPAWCYILVSNALIPFAKKIVQGTLKDYLISYYQDQLNLLDYSKFENKAVILKGCSKKEIPNEIYTQAIPLLVKVSKSVMFGEACSAVPIFKRQK